VLDESTVEDAAAQPERFQFKADTDGQGVSDRLSGAGAGIPMAVGAGLFS
jgi:hypothetical protein